MSRDVFGKHYQRIWNDLTAVRKYILAAIALFVAGTILAMAIPAVGERVLAAALEHFKPLKDNNAPELFVAIFLQNASSAFLAIAFGFLLGISPVLGAFFNGIVLGAIVHFDPRLLFMIIPHGIIELPSLFISWGLGLWCAGGLFHTQQRLETIIFRIKKSLNIYLSLIVPLLIIAALVEVCGIMVLFATSPE